MAETVLNLVPGHTDKELAENFKRRLVEAHAPVLQLLGELHEAGFKAQVMTAPGPLGKFVIAQLALFKEF